MRMLLTDNAGVDSFNYSDKQLESIACQLTDILCKQKVYTNPNLTITDMANMVGTNRTYVSSSINTFYNQNFCSYVNQFRLEAMRTYLLEDQKISNKELASNAGFGSVDTMKRVVKQKTGLSITDWKRQVHIEKRE